MTFQQEIAALQARIVRARSERDTWRNSGMQHKYLEAYSLVEALELQLERLRQEGLRSFARAPEPASALLTGTASAIADAPDERARLMAEFRISYDGRHYRYDRYRYDRLADALRYARQQAANPDATKP